MVVRVVAVEGVFGALEHLLDAEMRDGGLGSGNVVHDERFCEVDLVCMDWFELKEQLNSRPKELV